MYYLYTARMRAESNILRHLKHVPMAMALPAIATGIVLADGVGVPLWVVILLFIASGVVAWFWRGWVAILLFIALGGATSLTLRRATESRPLQPTTMELLTQHIISDSDSLRTLMADLVAYDEGGTMRRSGSSVRLITPISANCTAGERLVVFSRVNPYDSATSYGEYLSSKGIAGSVRVSPHDILRREEYFSLGAWLQQRAQQRIDMLNLEPETKSIASAISIGQRSHITPSQRRNYTLAGGAHLLAVSGLHVGFVFVFINLLLTPLATLRRGTLWRTLLCIGFIWSYAAMAALSPSVVRAATMFTIFQLSYHFSSRSLSLNTLCATSTLMLLWDGRMLYDIGFLLSVVAVAAIVEWATPMLAGLRSSDEEKLRRLRYMLQHPVRGRLRQVGRRIGRWMIAGIVVSLVANIATLPLVALHFGEVSLWGVVVGFAMISLCSVATTVMLSWVLIPVPCMAPVVRWIVEASVGAMNSIAQWCADSTALSFSLRLEGWSCGAIYMAFLLFTLALWSRSSDGRGR